MDECRRGTSRRGFLRLLASAGALLSAGASPGHASTRSWDIHRATRNTRLGAVGVRLPRLKRPPPPFKSYRGKRRVALPPIEAEPGGTLSSTVRSWTESGSFSQEPLTIAELARLLYLANGITSKQGPGAAPGSLRAAPSAGALYAGEVYLVADRIVGLPAGIYYYRVDRHALVEVVVSDSAFESVSRAQSRPTSFKGAAAAVILTSVFDRYSWRYANRGYRYALIDTGHIGENLRLAAAAVRLAEHTSFTFHDDVLNDLLLIDGLDEAVCSVHALGRRGEAPDMRAPAGARPLVERSTRDTPIDVSGTIPRRYHASTKLIPLAGGEPQAPPATPPAVVSAGGVALPVPRPEIRMLTGDAIRVRRSTRRFSAAAVAVADLSYVLEMAMGHAALVHRPGIDLYVAAHRVEGLNAGLLLYRREGHRLERIQAKPLADDLVRVCLGQKKAGEAAAAILMVAQLGPNAAHARTRRYRDLLIEAGAVGQRIYLSAEACGLTARNLAAFIDDDLNRLLGLDGTSQAVVHLTLVGAGD